MIAIGYFTECPVTCQCNAIVLRPQALLHHLVALSPRQDLLLTELSQLVDGWSIASDNTLSHLDASAECILPDNGIGRRLGRNLDDTNSWVLWSSVMLAIAEITQPGFQSFRIVLSDN